MRTTVIIAVLVAGLVVAAPAQAPRPTTLRVVGTELADGVAGRGYEAVLRADGGRPPYTWAITRGALPAGLELDENGQITGVPRAPGRSEIQVRVTDSSRPSRAATAEVAIRVAAPLEIATFALPPSTPDTPYRVRLIARGGVPPYHWQMTDGTLPRGLFFHPESGLLSGIPREAGEFQAAFRVTDSGKPPQTASRRFGWAVAAPLAVTWVQSPAVRDGGIFGSLRVSNGTSEDVDLTVVVVAVNEIGKAFTLGYQRFPLARDSESVDIPFGFSMPRGRYVVHADAVGEMPALRRILRARREHPGLAIE